MSLRSNLPLLTLSSNSSIDVTNSIVSLQKCDTSIDTSMAEASSSNYIYTQYPLPGGGSGLLQNQDLSSTSPVENVDGASVKANTMQRQVEPSDEFSITSNLNANASSRADNALGYVECNKGKSCSSLNTDL